MRVIHLTQQDQIQRDRSSPDDHTAGNYQLFSGLQYLSVRRHRLWSRTFSDRRKGMGTVLLAGRSRALPKDRRTGKGEHMGNQFQRNSGRA